MIRKEIKRSTVILLGILFLSYVIGDYLTTSWLIHNDPVGIANESNPIASTLYHYFGHSALLFVKLAAFLAIGSVVYFVEVTFPHERRLNKLKKWVLIGLIIYSFIIVLNNLSAIIALI